MDDPRDSSWWRFVQPLAVVLGRLLAIARRADGVVAGAAAQAQLERGAAGCGPGLRVNGAGRFTGLGALVIGDNVHIGADAFVRAEGGLRIGDNTHLSRRVTIYSINHEYEGQRLPYDDTTRRRPVTIGRNVWIGMGVTILPGTTVGDGAILGAGAVVAGDVPPLTIVGAPLAAPLGERDAAHYADRDTRGLYGGRNGRPLG